MPSAAALLLLLFSRIDPVVGLVTARQQHVLRNAQGPGEGAPPPPKSPPTIEEAQAETAAAWTGVKGPGMHHVITTAGDAPLVTNDLAFRAASLAKERVNDIFGTGMLPPHEVFDLAKGVKGSSPIPGVPSPVDVATHQRHGPPKPPHCAAPPRNLTKGDIQMAMQPFLPEHTAEKAMPLKDGGSAWKLKDGGWAFQYPHMVARTELTGATRIAWPDQQYAVEYDPMGISYHKGQTVIHRDITGDLTYQQPTGTIHQEGDTTIYHWCHPNVIVYHTPSGLVYYDDDGMTYRGDGGLAFYARTGDVVYQGTGGITRQTADGDVQHWTDAGVIYRHNDGSVTYTAVGESQPQTLLGNELGADPFPGPPLSIEEVQQLVRSADRWEGQHEATDNAIATAADLVAREAKEAVATTTGAPIYMTTSTSWAWQKTEATP